MALHHTTRNTQHTTYLSHLFLLLIGFSEMMGAISMRDYYIAILVGSIARRPWTEPMGGTNIARWYATSCEEFWERIDIICSIWLICRGRRDMRWI